MKKKVVQMVIVASAIVVLVINVSLGLKEKEGKKDKNTYTTHQYHSEEEELKSKEPGMYQPGPLKYVGNRKFVPKYVKFTPWEELEEAGVIIIKNGELSSPMDYEGDTLATHNISGVLILPDNIDAIAEDTFNWCSFERVLIPEGVRTIKAGAFSGCGGLTYISLPESLEIIGESAFDRCENVKIKVPEGVREIGDNAFRNVEHVEYCGSAKYRKGDKYWGAKAMN